MHSRSAGNLPHFGFLVLTLRTQQDAGEHSFPYFVLVLTLRIQQDAGEHSFPYFVLVLTLRIQQDDS